MPLHQPLKSGVHKTACFALYRALLRQCTRLDAAASSASPSPPGRRRAAQHAEQAPARADAALARTVVRRRFRADARLRSPPQVVEMLKQGYDALSVLASLTGAPHGALARDANEQLARVAATPKREPAPRQKPARAPNSPAGPSHPRPARVLDRPLPRSALAGARHVPRFVSAMGVPFLRLRKPQPAVLSSIIRHRHRKKQLRQDQLAALEGEHEPLARCEDAWDGLVGGGGADGSEVTYTDAVRAARGDVLRDMGQAARENAERAKRLWEIVMAERALKFEEEGVLVPLLGRRPDALQGIMARRKAKQEAAKEAEGGEAGTGPGSEEVTRPR